jgi:ethanolamine utilization microcompartment shell protein EutS
MNKKMVKLAMIVSLGFIADSFCGTVLVKNLHGEQTSIEYELDDTVSKVIKKNNE